MEQMTFLLALGILVISLAIVEAFASWKSFRTDRTIFEPWLNLRRLDSADGFQSARIYWFSIGWKFAVGFAMILFSIWLSPGE